MSRIFSCAALSGLLLGAMHLEFEKMDGGEPSSAASAERACLFFTCRRVVAYPNRHETVVCVSDNCFARVGVGLSACQMEFSN